MQKARQEETLAALALRLAARIPCTQERTVPWFVQGLFLSVIPYLAFAALLVIAFLSEFYGYMLFVGVIGLLLGRSLSFSRNAQPLGTKAAVQDIQHLRGWLQRELRPDDIGALLTLMERLGQHSGDEARALAVELQDVLTRALPFLTFIELQSLRAEQRAFLIATLRERTGLTGAVGADWTIAVLLTLATLQDTGATPTARTLALRDHNDRVREAATEYLKAVS